MSLNFVKVQNRKDLENFYPVIKELRKDLTKEEFFSLFEAAQKLNHFEMVGIEENGKIIAAMGFRLLIDFVHGKHLYIDDLVTTENYRSKGLGAKLLQHAEEMAREYSCKGLRLSTGVDNDSAKRFYERNGWSFRSVVYKKKISSESSVD